MTRYDGFTGSHDVVPGSMVTTFEPVLNDYIIDPGVPTGLETAQMVLEVESVHSTVFGCYLSQAGLVTHIVVSERVDEPRPRRGLLDLAKSLFTGIYFVNNRGTCFPSYWGMSGNRRPIKYIAIEDYDLGSQRPSKFKEDFERIRSNPRPEMTIRPHQDLSIFD